MRKYICLILILVCSNLFAQNTVVGKVTDKTNFPIPGARVTFNNNEYITYTMSDGSFIKPEWLNVRSIEVQYLGFYDVKVSKKHHEDIKMRRIMNNNFFASFVAGFPDIDQITPSYGFMVGWYREFGIYLKGLFRTNKHHYDMSGDNISSVWLDGRRYTSYNSITVGTVVNIYKPLSIYLGAGYTWRDIIYRYYDVGYYYHNNKSYRTVGLDMGIMMAFKPLVLSAGCTYAPSHGFTGNFGIGIIL